MSRLDPGGLMRAANELGAAALDPALWPEIMEEFARAASATGAVLLQSDVRTPDVPRTAGVEELMKGYFAEGWPTRDTRAERGVPLLLAGKTVITDEDFITLDEMRREPHYWDFMRPLGFQWFAGVAFLAGSALWVLCLQRSPREGPYDAADKRVLAELPPLMTASATLSAAIGRKVISGVTNALDLIRQPALVIDRFGRVLDHNSAAAGMLDNEIRLRGRRLAVRDRAAQTALDRAIARLCAAPENATSAAASVVVRREPRSPVVARIVPIPAAAGGPFFGARALITLTELDRTSAPDLSLLVTSLGLSRAEARLAAALAGGAALSAVAEQLGLSRETLRNQLKAIFAKTDTYRQSELVALLSRLRL
jgi:DNA-binding CsgD family transcriptional regulator